MNSRERESEGGEWRTHKLPARQVQRRVWAILSSIPSQVAPACSTVERDRKGGQKGRQEACGKGQRNHRERGRKGVHESFLELERMERMENCHQNLESALGQASGGGELSEETGVRVVSEAQTCKSEHPPEVAESCSRLCPGTAICLRGDAGKVPSDLWHPVDAALAPG